MSNAATPFFNTPGRGWRRELLRWVLPRLAVYVAAAVGGAILFLVWATAYVAIWPAPPIPVPSINSPERLPVPIPAPYRQGTSAPLVGFDGTIFPSTVALVGVEIYGPGNEKIGQISDVVTDPTGGSVKGVVVGLGGSYWFNKKFVLIPFEDVNLDVQQDPVSKVRATVPYNLGYLQKLPLTTDYPIVRPRVQSK